MSARPRTADEHRTRFLSKIEKQPNGCWLWKGRCQNKGYGLFDMGSRHYLAHRAAYQLFVGAIPPGLDLDHLCVNPPCVNPAHLEAVTTWENLYRSRNPVIHNLDKTHCPQGHPYEGDNLYIGPNGGRYCKECRRARFREWFKRKRANTLPTPPRPRITHCIRGHEFTPANTRWKGTVRSCRKCEYLRNKANRKLLGRARGEQNGAAKLTMQQVREMRALHTAGTLSYRQLAERFAISRSHAWKVVTGGNWHE